MGCGDAPRFTLKLCRTATVAPALVLAVATLLWVGQDCVHYRRESRELREQMLQERRREIVREVDRAIAVVAQQQATLEDRVMRELEGRVSRACGIAHVIYEQHQHDSREEVERIIGRALSPALWNDGSGQFFAVDRTGRQVATDVLIEREGSYPRVLLALAAAQSMDEILRVVGDRGAGFVRTLSSAIGDEGAPTPILAHAREFAPLGWVVGVRVCRAEMAARARDAAIEHLGSTGLDEGDDCLFVLDEDGRPLISAGRDDRETLELLRRVEVDGTPLIDRLMSAAREPGGGFVRYPWRKPSLSSPGPKLSYVRAVPEWGWTIGTGVYLDDIEAAMTERRESMIAGFAVRLALMLLATALLTALSLSVSHRIASGLVGEFDEFERSLARSVSDEQSIDASVFHHAEMRTIAAAVNSMQQGLCESKERYRTVFESTGTAMCMVAADGTVLLVNEEFSRNTGCSNEEIECGRHFTEFVAPRDVERVQGYHQARRTGDEEVPGSYEIAYLDGEGRQRHALITVGLIPGSSISVASLLDITERKQAEEEMRLSNARLELLNSMSRQINAGGSLGDAVQGSCDTLKELLGCHYVELFLPAVSAEGCSECAPWFSAGDTPGGKPEGLAGPLIAHGPAEIITASTEPQEFRGRDELLGMIADLIAVKAGESEALAATVLDALDVQYVCQLPLPGEGGAVGRLAVGKREETRLNESEMHFLEQYAEQLGLLITKWRTEEALYDSESNYRLLFNNGNDAMYVHRLPSDGPPGSFIAVNDVACEMLGYSRAELLEMSPADIEAPGQWRRVPDLPERLETEGEAIHDAVYVSRDGTEIPVEISSHLFEMDGQPTVLSIARNVTERVRFEQRLRRVNECFLGFTADPMENIGRLIELCGEVMEADWAAYVRLDTGRLRGVACWHLPERLSPPEDPTGLICEHVVEAGGSDVVALTDLIASPFADTDPNVRDFGAVSYLGKAVRSHAGTEGSVCAFYRDHFEPTEEDRRLIGIIAAAIRVEEERRQVREQHERTLEEMRVLNRDLELARHEAEEANSLKSEFLANTSHEIRTPLNGIIGYLQLVLNGLCDDRDEEREFIAGAHESAEHLLALINDVLDVARIEAGKLRVDPEEVGVAALLADVNSLVRVQAEQSGLDLVFHPVAADLTAWCDEERLKQVMVNLVGNAIKFTSEGGTITVEVGSNHYEGTVHFEIADTGVGIAPDKLDAIFDKFVQADGSTTRQRGGSGLGLTISQRLVEMMGGTLSAHSDGEGRGSTFRFTVPLYRSGNAADGAVPRFGVPAPLDPDRPLVLVVEDDPLYRRYLEELLAKLGCETAWAATADDALRVLDTEIPRAITIDYSLPAFEGARLNTGWDLLVELQKDERLSRSAMIVVTGDMHVIGRKMMSEHLPDRVAVLDKREVSASLAAVIEDVTMIGDREQPVDILLADDDATFRRVIDRLLGGRDYRFHHVPDGAECLEYLREHGADIDLLLLDLRMPGVSGYEVLRDLRRHEDTVDLPVLVVTAYPEPDSPEQRMILAGGGRTGLLVKHEVLSDPSGFHAVLGQFLEASAKAA